MTGPYVSGSAMKREGQVPCVFRGTFIREQVDPRVKAAWPGRAPWGDLRKTWKGEHCVRVSGTGYPDDCPYVEEDCALAFLQCVLSVVDADRPMALFRTRAKMMGAERADNKPLAREGDPKGRRSHLDEERRQDPSRRDVQGIPGVSPPYLPHAAVRPTQIGDVLRSYDFGSRQGRADDGEESTRR